MSNRRKVAITGGNGLIGSALANHLLGQGMDVIILSRSGSSKVKGATGVFWSPRERKIDLNALGKVDSWVHLAGANIGAERWTKARRKVLRESRIEATQFLIDTILSIGNYPDSFVSASGTGYYGSTSKPTDENAPPGSTFLADLCEDWEKASMPLENAGIRRVVLRTGMVLSPEGGALSKMLPPFKLGLGGRLGPGDQVWNWIHIADLVGIYAGAILSQDFTGIYNAVAPDSLSNKDFTQILGDVLNRPTILPAPGLALKLVMGQMAEELLLSGQNVIPKRLLEQGFEFHYPSLKPALANCLAS